MIYTHIDMQKPFQKGAGEMKRKVSTRIMSLVLAAAMFCSLAGTVSADTWAYKDHSAVTGNQPLMLGHRIIDLKNWNPQTDPWADLMRAEVPLQTTIDPYAATQANPALGSEVEVMYMAGDYGNSFNQGTPYNNQFSENMFNFWQYIDYYCAWHGAAVAGTPLNIWDGYNEQQYGGDGWKLGRNFEFGSINMPNPAYTNAAHKNGVLSMGCVYFDPNNRPGQPLTPLLEQDENGSFIIAEKLIEYANWYGFDGYFFNQEERISADEVPLYKKFIQQCREGGLYCQMYDSLNNDGGIDAWASTLDADTWALVEDDEIGSVNDSVFISYDWSTGNKMATSVANMKAWDVDPYKQVFFGVEGNQGKMASRGHNSTYNFAEYMYKNPGTDDKTLNGSVALFTSDGFIHDQIEDAIKAEGSNNREKDEYQWMVFERERMYFSGANSDPTDTGEKAGASREDLGLSDVGGWVGVADFKAEQSVAGGGAFYTDFNTGHGLQYYVNGAVSNSEEWGNMNLQGILPTWQWWIDTEGTKLSVDFDYGPTYKKFDVNGNEMNIGYTQVGAYKGGSSLVISGTLDAQNLIHLFKTDLSVSAGSKAKITYNKPSASDSTQMKLALTFKGSDAVEYIALPESGTETNGWKTATVDLSKYAGKKIAAIALAIDPRQANPVEGYQVNIGAVTVTDGASHTPAAPQNLAIEKAYNTNEMILTWDKADYDTVKEYNVYATYADGTKKMLGGIYGSKFYVKNTGDGITGIEVVAVGADGSESAAARVDYSYGTKVGNLTVEEAMTSTGYFSQSAAPGQVKASWTAPSGDFDSYALELTLDYSNNKTVYTATADKKATEAVVKVPVNEGAKYTLAVSTVKDGVKNEPVCYGGYLKDTYCAPYDGVVRISGNTLFLDSPSAADWWQISVSCNGKELSIPNKYSANNTRGWKGVARLNAISLPDEYGVIEVVMTDYSGNVSATKAIPFAKNPDAEITEAMIPDEALRTKLTEIIGGNTIGELLAYEGALDLSDIGVKDLTGLNLVVGATSIDLSGNTELETIQNVFAGMTNLSELNISGMSGLVVFDIHNSQVEKIVCDDPSALESIVYVDVSGCRLDLSEDTPEADFVAAMEALIADKEDVLTVSPDEIDFAPTGTVLSGNARLFNGDDSQYAYPLENGDVVVVDLGTEQTVKKWAMKDWGSSYGVKSFTLSVSSNGENWTEVLTKSDCTGGIFSGTLDTPAVGRYFKFTLNEKLANSAAVYYFKLIGNPMVITEAVVISDAQRPAVYYAETEDEAVTVRADGTPADVMQWAPKAVTVRGTAFADLADADFIAEFVDIEGIANSVEAVIAAGEEILDGTVIDTAVKGVYTVSYAADGEQLKTVTVTVAVDTSALEGLVETAEAIDTGKYSEESVKALEEALEEAKAVLADEDATQAEVDAAYEALSNAINGLKEPTDQPDTGDYAGLVPVLVLLVLAAAGTVIFVKRRKSLAK